MKRHRLKERIIMSEDLIEGLEKDKDRCWQIEEVLRANNLLEKVESWANFRKCPICEEDFQDGDLGISYRIPIHSRCFGKLRRKKRESV